MQGNSGCHFFAATRGARPIYLVLIQARIRANCPHADDLHLLHLFQSTDPQRPLKAMHCRHRKLDTDSKHTTSRISVPNDTVAMTSRYLDTSRGGDFTKISHLETTWIIPKPILSSYSSRNCEYHSCHRNGTLGIRRLIWHSCASFGIYIGPLQCREKTNREMRFSESL